jgi:uncharacterized membrane protein
MTTLTDRLDHFEWRLRDLELELADLRRVAAAGQVSAPEPRPEPEPAPEPAPRPSAPLPPRPERRPAFERPQLDLGFLFSARALAWTGGAVTLLGIVFFFVLAVDRGWIGPAGRVGLGALASAVLFGAGFWLRRRYGDTYAAVSAVGAGIAGAYATLLAAAALYDLLPAPVALVVAAGIAAAGAGVALAWGSETIAALGLVGAMLVPVPVALQGSLTALGTAFAAFVLAPTLGLAIRREWRGLLVASIVATSPKALVLVATDRPHRLALAIVFWLIFAVAGVAHALRVGLRGLPASTIVWSGAFAGYCAGFVFDGRSEGLALLAIAIAYGVGAAALARPDRDLASLLGAIALAVGAVAAADLVSNATLTMVWAAEAAVLAWLARRVREPRFQLAALAWLALALVHTLTIDAPFARLFVENPHPATGVPSVLAAALAALLVGLAAFERTARDEGALLQEPMDALRRAQAHLRVGGVALAGALGIYAASLAILALAGDWDRGHVGVAALWSAVATTTMLVGLVPRRPRVLTAGLFASGATIVLAAGYDAAVLEPSARSWAFAVVAAGLLVGAVSYALLGPSSKLEPYGVGGVLAATGFATSAATQLLDGRAEGAALLGIAAVYALLATAVLRRHRDLATLLGALALLLAAGGSREVLGGTSLVLAWTVAAVALAAAARYEERLEVAALAYVTLAVGHALALDAPPTDLVVAGRHPGAGVPAVALAVAALFAIARLRPAARAVLGWTGGAVALYGASLAILEAFEDVGGGVETAFQRGHTTVSALWGLVGVALLYTGLRRGERALQLGGFALFGVSLAKLFVYDLSFLSSVARAFSFLAVGGVLLLAGFFYQRLTVDSQT